MQAVAEFRRVKVICLETGQVKEGDVLRWSEKQMRVALEGTVIALDFHREGPRRRWIARMAGLEFEAR